ncbi:5-methylcytosine restriction system specificity protein McrC [Chryseobacterium sp. 8AT]|nr:restriction endonuclease [Chryseobacterium sp. 8AT]VXC56625.1 Restriction endonuclease [Chryseobacterium sp. 8AT]
MNQLLQKSKKLKSVSSKLIKLYEHWSHSEELLEIKENLYFKKNNAYSIFHYENIIEKKVKKCVLQANYYIGIGSISPHHHIFVSPKINSKLLEKIQNELDDENIDHTSEVKMESEEEVKALPEVDVLKMLTEIVKLPDATKEISELLDIDWDAPKIEVSHVENDYLSPFLIIQFIHLIKTIVKKGLKKSYYSVEENLNSRIKGKILIPQTIKQNILKNRLTYTNCKYQEFGYNNIENRFLKKVLEFVKKYVSTNDHLLSSVHSEIRNSINYISSAYVLITPLEDIREIKGIKHNTFYKQYKEAIQIGELILKNFSYSITKSNRAIKETPPYWIDMSRLFELYVFKKLIKNPEFGKIKYHWRTFGNEVDFIGFYNNSEKGKEIPIIIDAKYKLHYENSKEHQDMRQVAGYARLKKVYNHFSDKANDANIIDCLIVYPILNKESELKISEIKAYQNIYKMGICLPIK